MNEQFISKGLKSHTQNLVLQTRICI